MEFLSLELDFLKKKHDVRVVIKPFKTLKQELPLLSPDLRLIFNQTWFTKYLVLTAHETTLARLANVLKLEKKNTCGV